MQKIFFGARATRVAKPAAGTNVNTAHALAPNYAAWLLTGNQSPEANSLLATSTAATSGTAPTQSTNQFGEPCLLFGGAGGLYPVTNLVVPTATNNRFSTLIARVYPNSSSGYDTIYGHSAGGFFLNNGIPVFYPVSAATSAVTNGAWSTVGVTIEHNVNTKYYINGVLINTISASAGVPYNATQLGIGRDAAGEYFDGKIDYVMIWNNLVADFPAANHMAIHLDPYQVFTASAGGPAPFNAFFLAL